MIATTENSFVKDVLERDGLTIVFFCGENCRACGLMRSVLDSINARVVKVDIGACPDIANYYCVTTLPTLLFIRDGEVVETMTGAQSKQKIKRVLEELLL